MTCSLSLREWRRVWYSDESKFNLFGSDGRRWCRRETGEELCDRCLDVQVKHGGGNVMVWGDISWNGVGRLHRVEGNMDAAQYCKILSQSLLGSLSDQKTAPSSIIFQQDNDSKHTSRMAARWFEDHDITVLLWPSSSPDMNLIKHVWDVLDWKLRARLTKPSNRDQLWEILQEEWDASTSTGGSRLCQWPASLSTREFMCLSFQSSTYLAIVRDLLVEGSCL